MSVVKLKNDGYQSPGLDLSISRLLDSCQSPGLDLLISSLLKMTAISILG